MRIRACKTDRRRAMYAMVLGGLVASGGGVGVAAALANPCATARKQAHAQSPATPASAEGVQWLGAAKNPRARARDIRVAAHAAACGPCAPAGCAPGARTACDPCAPAACGPADDDMAARFTRPDGYIPVESTRALARLGETLWNDTSLSTNGLSCMSCHAKGGSLNATFAQPYPHRVAMPAQMGGVAQVHADEMVQFCMIAPMQAEPLAWDSEALAALTAFTLELQQDFDPAATHGAAGGACEPSAPAVCGPCGPAGCGPCAPAACDPCGPAQPQASTGVASSDAAAMPVRQRNARAVARVH